MTSRGQCPRGGCACECPRVGCFSNFLRSDDVTWTMSKGGVLVKNPVSAPGPPPFKNPGSAPVVYSFRSIPVALYAGSCFGAIRRVSEWCNAVSWQLRPSSQREHVNASSSSEKPVQRNCLKEI